MSNPTQTVLPTLARIVSEIGMENTIRALARIARDDAACIREHGRSWEEAEVLSELYEDAAQTLEIAAASRYIRGLK